MPSVISFLVFLLVLFVALAIRNIQLERERKLYRLLGQGEEGEPADWSLPKLKSVERLEQWMLQAGIVMPVYRFMGYVALVVGGFFTFGLVLTYNFAASLLIGLIGLFAVWYWVRRQSNKRRERFENQLEAIVAVLSSSLRAGASLAQAVDNAAAELDALAASEFVVASHEIDMGVPAAEALHRLADRVRSEDMKMLATAATVHSRAGGNLAEIMDNLAGTVRDRKALRSALKAYTAEGRLSGIVVGLMPFAVVAVLLVINPGYFAPMLANPAGRVAMALSFIMIFVGWYIIRQITQNMDF